MTKLGIAYHSLKNFEKAIEYHVSGLNIAKETDNKHAEGCACGSLGEAYYSLSDFENATYYYELCLTCFDELKDQTDEGTICENLGNSYQRLGNFEKAIHFHERHLRRAKEVEDRTKEGHAYENLGTAYINLGNFKQAIEYYQAGLGISQEVKDSVGEIRVYGGLGNAHHGLGNFKKAKDYYELCMEIAVEMQDRAAQGLAHGNLGNAFASLGNFKQAIDEYEQCRTVAEEMNDSAAEMAAYGNLANIFNILGDFKKAKDNNERLLNIAEELGDKATQGKTYGNLGCVYHSLGKFEEAVKYHKQHLEIVKESGDKDGERRVYGNLGNVYTSLGNFEEALDYHTKDLKIANEVENMIGVAGAYAGLGEAYVRTGNFEKAKENYESCLKIAKEAGHVVLEGVAYHGLGASFESLGRLTEAVDRYQSSVETLNDIRFGLQFKDDLKISFRDIHQAVYTGLWRVFLKQGKVVESLVAAEEGRAQALKDLVQDKYGFQSVPISSCSSPEETTSALLNCLPSNTVFTATGEHEVIYWIIQNQDVKLRRKEIYKNGQQHETSATFLESLVENAYQKISGRVGSRCEDRSLDKLRDEDVTENSDYQTQSHTSELQEDPLRTLFDVTIGPIETLIHGDELVIVPDGALFLAPYAAFMNSSFKYLCDSFRIRVIPSLSSLKMISDCPGGYHREDGALLVGDPWLQDIIKKRKKVFDQLPGAREEVEIIGKIIGTVPLTGKEATKEEVLKHLSTAALVHIAAHGSMATGEIALAPNPTRKTQVPKEKDYLLTISDVLGVQLRAKLVVLSCCHSGRGKIKAEGVVGIARAFLGAGARSVLVTLWAVDDKATLEFMKSFYKYLVQGRKASESVNQAMKYLRETEDFNEVRYWAPFVLIGDDVTLQFNAK